MSAAGETHDMRGKATCSRCGATYADVHEERIPVCSPTPVIGGREEIEAEWLGHDYDPGIHEDEDKGEYCWAHVRMDGHGDCMRPVSAHGPRPDRALLALKAENARLAEENAELHRMGVELQHKYAALTAEVERLKGESEQRFEHFRQTREAEEAAHVEIAKLKAERDEARQILELSRADVLAIDVLRQDEFRRAQASEEEREALTIENEGLTAKLRALGVVDFNSPGVESWKHAACAMKDAAREAVGLAPMYDVDPIL